MDCYGKLTDYRDLERDFVIANWNNIIHGAPVGVKKITAKNVGRSFNFEEYYKIKIKVAEDSYEYLYCDKHTYR